MVFLKDVPARHMELLLAYMYKGEILVQESEMKDFIETATSLQVIKNLKGIKKIFKARSYFEIFYFF